MNKNIIKNFIVLLAVTFSVLIGCSGAGNKNEQKLEQLLNITIPNNVTQIQYVKELGSDEFMKPYDVYIRAKMPEEAYLDIIEQLQLTVKTAEKEDEYTVLLLSQLHPRKNTPSWWNPDPIANEFFGAGNFQNAVNPGWIVATYNHEYGYFKIFEESIP